MQTGKDKRVIMVKLEDGEKLIEGLEAAAKKYKIKSGIILCGIGMFSSVKLGYFNGKEYQTKEFTSPVELISLSGNIATTDKTILHMHCCISGEDKKAYAGHVFEATVGVANEIAIMKVNKLKLTRKKNKFGIMGLEIGK